MAKLQGVFTVRWQASDGKGVSIVSKSVKYAKYDSGTTAPEDGWQDSIPSITDGAFLWTWTHIEYSDGNVTDSYSVSRQGIDGKGIKSSTTDYKQMENTNIAPENITGWGSFPTNLTDGWWLYTRQTVTYSDGATAVSYSVVQIGQGSYYAGLSEYYCASDSPNVPPSGYPKKTHSDGSNYLETEYPLLFAKGETISIGNNWISTRSEVKLNSETPYLWNFEISRDSKGNQYVTFPSLIGNFSKGIISIVEAYAISAYDKPDKGGLFPSDIEREEDWTDESLSAAPTDAKPYQWNRTTITYNDGDTDVHYHVSAIKSKGQAYVMLENEMDSLLYDDAYTLIGGNVSTVARFFYDGVDISDKFTINSTSEKGCYIAPSGEVDGYVSLSKPNNKITLTVSGIKSTSGHVDIVFVYNGVSYTKRFTVKRIVGGAKYQLECTPNIISYNETTETLSSSLVVTRVAKIGSQGIYTKLATLVGTGLYLRINGVKKEPKMLPRRDSITAPSDSSQTKALTVELLQGDWESDSGIVIDTQDIPYAKTENGADGAQGNGIKSETHYCMFTMTFDQPAANDSGWVQLTDDNKSTYDSNKVTKRNRYLWLKKVYEYDNGDIRALVSLLSQYVDGVEANLLRETAFASDGDMEAWTPANGYIAYEAFGHNNAFVRVMDSDYDEEEKGIDTILQQYVLGEDSNVILKKDTWYTLSFYAQNDAFFRLYEDSTLTGTFTYTMPLKAGKLVTIRYNIENNTIYRLVLMYKADNYEGSYHTVPLDGNIAISFTPNYTDSYTLYIGLIDSSNNWVSVTSNQPHIQSLDIDRGKGIDVHIPFLNGSEPLYHNGNVNGTFFTWDLTTEWQHCYVTFKSKARSIYSADAYIKFLLSKSSNTTYICMPKLEENTAATAWIENHLDRVTEQASHILAGDWKENIPYYYLQGVRQVVRYYSDSTKTETRYYRLRKKTSPTGYASETPPYEDTEHWEEAKHMPFFSSDFVMSEEIMAKIMQVVQLKADEIITRSLVAMRDYKVSDDKTIIQQKIASINEEQFPAGAIVQYWQAESDADAYNPQKKMVISDGVIEYYNQNGTLEWRLGGSGTIERPTQESENVVYLVFVCSGGDNTPSDTSSIRTSSILKGTEYKKNILSNEYKDMSGNLLNGWYTLPGAPFITKPNEQGFMPAFRYYRQVFRLYNGKQAGEKIVYFNTSETVIIE